MSLPTLPIPPLQVLADEDALKIAIIAHALAIPAPDAVISTRDFIKLAARRSGEGRD
jgi:hypothetical protein